MGKSCRKAIKFLKSSLTNLVTVVLSILLIFVICPLLSLILLPFFLYRQVVITLAKLFKKDTLGKVLSTRSAAACMQDRFYESPTFTLSCGAIVEGKVDLDHVRRTVINVVNGKNEETGELRYPEMFMNISFWMGYPFWRKLKEVNLEKQIGYYKNDPHQQTNHEQAKEIVKELAFTPFSKDKPLWQLIILPNYTPDPAPNITPQDIQEKKYSFIIVAIHHGVADGFSLLKLMERFSITPEFDLIKPFDYTHKGQRHLSQRIFRNLTLAFKIPWDISKSFVKGLLVSKIYKWADSEVGESLQGKDPRWTELMNRLHVEASDAFLLREINDVKIKHGVSGTAVLYSGVVGAARRLFKGGNMPQEITFIFPLPLLGRSDKLRNDFTLTSLPFPLREKDGVKRLQKIQKRLDQLKKSTLPICMIGLYKIVGGMPRWFSRWGLGLSRDMETVGVSNIAGPKGRIDLCGYIVKDLLFMSGINVLSSGLGVMIISQGGQVRVGVAADEKVMKNGEGMEFLNNFFKELDILKTIGAKESVNSEPEAERMLFFKK